MRDYSNVGKCGMALFLLQQMGLKRNEVKDAVYHGVPSLDRSIGSLIFPLTIKAHMRDRELIVLLLATSCY